MKDISINKLKDFIDLLDLDMSYVEQEAIYVSPLENKIEKKDYALMTYKAQKFNTINFKAPVNDLISVQIGGAIFFPGSYTLNQDSTLQDLYESFTDVNYHTEAQDLGNAIEWMEDPGQDANRAQEMVEEFLENFREACMKTLKDITRK